MIPPRLLGCSLFGAIALITIASGTSTTRHPPPMLVFQEEEECLCYIWWGDPADSNPSVACFSIQYFGTSYTGTPEGYCFVEDTPCRDEESPCGAWNSTYVVTYDSSGCCTAANDCVTITWMTGTDTICYDVPPFPTEASGIGAMSGTKSCGWNAGVSGVYVKCQGSTIKAWTVSWGCEDCQERYPHD